VSDRVQALDTQIRRELRNEAQEADHNWNTGMPGSRINQLKETFVGESSESRGEKLPSDAAALGISSRVSTYRQVFESYEGFEQKTENGKVSTSIPGSIEISPSVPRHHEAVPQPQQFTTEENLRQDSRHSFNEESTKYHSEIPIGKAVSNYRKLFENIASDNSADVEREKVSSHESLSQRSELYISTTDSEFQESARASSPDSAIFTRSDSQPKKPEVPLRRRSVSEYKSYFDSLEAADQNQRTRTPVLPEPIYRIREVRSASSYDSSSQKYQSSYSEQISSQGYPVSNSTLSPEPEHPDFRKFESLHEQYRPRPVSALSRFDTPQPSKFIPAKFTESDYESDFESFKIEPIWRPPGSRPHSAVEFRTMSPANFTSRDRDTIHTSQTSAFTSVQGVSPGPGSGKVKPVPPPKPILKKPVALVREPEQLSGAPRMKPIPPPKPMKCFPPVTSTMATGIEKTKSPPTTFTEQVTYDLEEPISDSLMRQTHLTSTLTKTEECKFILRPIKSPSTGLGESDEELQVRKSPLNYFVSVTSPPITTSRIPVYNRRPNTASPVDLSSESSTFNKTTFQEEKLLHTFEQSSSVESLQNSSTLTRADSPFSFRKSIPDPGFEKSKVRPKSEEFHSMVRTYSVASERPKSTEFASTRLEDKTQSARSNEIEHSEPRPPSREFVHRIKIDK